MAQVFADINYNTESSSIDVTEDGAALTLTNQVRVLYDDSSPIDQVIDALQRVKEALAREYN